MGAMESKLYWSQTTANGSPRSFGAKILDPVGACIQPAELEPWAQPDGYDVPADNTEDSAGDVSAPADGLKQDVEDAVTSSD